MMNDSCPGCGLAVSDVPSHIRERHHVEPEQLTINPPKPETYRESERSSGLIVVKDQQPSDGNYL